MSKIFTYKETERTKNCIKVLAVGNSFSEDATFYLRNMALADKIDLCVANLYIGGCSLERHYNNISNGTNDYVFTYFTPENICRINPVSLTWALESNDWDCVTVQQVSSLSGNYETFKPFAPKLINHIKSKVENAEIKLHMTWAYASDSERLAENGYASQNDMYLRIKDAYSKFREDTDNTQIIPTGEAVQKARGTFMSDGFNRDGFHLNVKGRILTGYVWYEIFTGISSLESKYNPQNDCEDITDSEIKAIKESAHSAVLEYRGR